MTQTEIRGGVRSEKASAKQAGRDESRAGERERCEMLLERERRRARDVAGDDQKRASDGASETLIFG